MKIKKEAIQIDNGKGPTIECLFEQQVLQEYGSGNVVTARMIERNNYLSVKEAIKACIPGGIFNIRRAAKKESVSGEKNP